MAISDVISAYKRDWEEALEQFGIRIPSTTKDGKNWSKIIEADTTYEYGDQDEFENAMQEAANAMFEDIEEYNRGS
jgi:hypothetical protein